MNYDSYIRDGRLCWTLTSNGYKYLTWNMYKSWIVAHPQQPLLVLCADTSAYSFLQREGVPCRMVKTRLPDYGPHIVTFGTNQFRNLNLLKLQLLAEFAADQRLDTCLYLDGDIVVYKPFLEDLEQRLEEHPLLFQCDEPAATCVTPAACPYRCTGFLVFKRGVDARIFKVDDRALWEKGAGQDQPYVNQRIAEYGVAAMTLPHDLYPNGMRQRHRGAEALMLHYNHMIGNQKIAAMKRAGDWTIAQI